MKLFNLSDIQKFRNIQGMYILGYENNVIYIGKSKNIYTRILEHYFNGKVFDEIWALSVSDENTLDILEQVFIRRMKPKENYERYSNEQFYIDEETLYQENLEQLVNESYQDRFRLTSNVAEKTNMIHSITKIIKEGTFRYTDILESITEASDRKLAKSILSNQKYKNEIFKWEKDYDNEWIIDLRDGK